MFSPDKHVAVEHEIWNSSFFHSHTSFDLYGFFGPVLIGIAPPSSPTHTPIPSGKPTAFPAERQRHPISATQQINLFLKVANFQQNFARGNVLLLPWFNMHTPLNTGDAGFIVHLFSSDLHGTTYWTHHPDTEELVSRVEGVGGGGGGAGGREMGETLNTTTTTKDLKSTTSQCQVQFLSYSNQTSSGCKWSIIKYISQCFGDQPTK